MTFPPSPCIPERVETARRYLVALEKFRHSDWSVLYDRHTRGELTLEESVALVHPEWYELDIRASEVRRGRVIDVPKADTCQSAVIWGYSCPLPGDQLQIDHLFPYSLGGPSVPSNSVVLCRDHNLAKGADIHLIPWEPQAFSWLDETIRKISQVRS